MKIRREFNDIGEKVTIQLTYKDRQISKLPENCAQCPVGYMHGECGTRCGLNVESRPHTCKLKVVDIESSLHLLDSLKEYITELDDEIDRCHKLAEQNVQDESTNLAEMMIVRVQTLTEVKNDLQSRLEELI